MFLSANPNVSIALVPLTKKANEIVYTYYSIILYIYNILILTRLFNKLISIDERHFFKLQETDPPSPSVSTLCFSACLYWLPSLKACCALIGQLSQAWAGSNTVYFVIIQITIIIIIYLTYNNVQYTQKHFRKETNKMKTISALGCCGNPHCVVVTSQPYGIWQLVEGHNFWKQHISLWIERFLLLSIYTAPRPAL